MSKCNIDHSLEDVMDKLHSQKEYLPSHLFAAMEGYLKEDRTQETLNELFHLLKKYDLASSQEKEERHDKIKAVIG